MLKTERIASDAAFKALRQEWTQLLDENAKKCLFLTWEWMHTWWTHFSKDRTLCIITVRRDDQLVAIAPLVTRPRNLVRLQPFRALEFLGSGDVGSDYLAMIMRDGYETESLRAISAHLSRENLVLDLSRFDRESTQMNSFVRTLQKSGWASTKTTSEASPYIPIKGQNWEDYTANLGRSHRTNFRKRVKALNKRFNVRFEAVTDEAERKAAMDRLVDWHLKRWEQPGGSTALHRTDLQNFHEEITSTFLKLGWLRLFVMWLDDKPVASMYCICYGNKYYFYQMGYDSEYNHLSVGLTATGLAIKSAFEEDMAEFDFLHGNERYKYLWTKEERELLRLDLFPPGLTGQIYKKSMHLRYELKKVLCYAQSLKPV